MRYKIEYYDDYGDEGKPFETEETEEIYIALRNIKYKIEELKNEGRYKTIDVIVIDTKHDIITYENTYTIKGIFE